MTKYLVFTEEQFEAGIAELATLSFHGGFLARREIGDPVAVLDALPAPSSSPVPEASGRGEVVQPTMHILRRADGEEMGEFAFWATDGPDGWDMAEDTDHDEDTVYEILACYPVARRKILRSTLCETCDGEGCPACAGSGECEPPDAEHMPIIARPAPSSSPVGGRGLDVTPPSTPDRPASSSGTDR